MTREQILQEAYARGFEKGAQEVTAGKSDDDASRKNKRRRALTIAATVAGAAGLGYSAYATRGAWRPHVRPYIAAASGKVDIDNNLGNLIRKLRRGEDADVQLAGHMPIIAGTDKEVLGRAAARRAPKSLRDQIASRYVAHRGEDLGKEFPQVAQAGGGRVELRQPTIAEMLLPAFLQQRDKIRVPPYTNEDALADALVGGYGRHSNVVDALISRIRERV